jgi:hypothetical protein
MSLAWLYFWDNTSVQFCGSGTFYRTYAVPVCGGHVYFCILWLHLGEVDLVHLFMVCSAEVWPDVQLADEYGSISRPVLSARRKFTILMLECGVCNLCNSLSICILLGCLKICNYFRSSGHFQSHIYRPVRMRTHPNLRWVHEFLQGSSFFVVSSFVDLFFILVH